MLSPGWGWDGDVFLSLFRWFLEKGIIILNVKRSFEKDFKSVASKRFFGVHHENDFSVKDPPLQPIKHHFDQQRRQLNPQESRLSPGLWYFSTRDSWKWPVRFIKSYYQWIQRKEKWNVPHALAGLSRPISQMRVGYCSAAQCNSRR